jgi:hypothetical protein
MLSDSWHARRSKQPLKVRVLVAAAFIVAVLAGPTGAPPSADAAALFWAVYSQVSSCGYAAGANIDGSAFQRGIAKVGNCNAFPQFVAIDEGSGSLYMTDIDYGVYRGQLDGSGASVIIPVTWASGITLDVSAGHLFFSTSGLTQTLSQANLDGTGVVSLTGGGPVSLALDATGQQLYQGGGPGIDRSDVDGTNLVPLISTSPYDVESIALDVAGNAIYWTDSSNSISRANLDGSNVTVLVSGLVRGPGSIAHEPLGLAVDPVGGKLYWDDDNGVSRADLDGTNSELLVPNDGPGSTFFQGMALCQTCATLTTTTSTTSTSSTTVTMQSTTSTTSTTTTTSTSSTTLPPPCPPTPASGCQAALSQKAQLKLAKGATASANKLTWKWVSSGSVATGDFGDPTTTAGYTLCTYDQTGLVMTATAPAGGTCGTKPCWSVSSSGAKYTNKLLTPDGLLKISLKAGGAGAGKIGVKGKGALLPLPTLPLSPPVRVQLIREDSGTCWEANYSTVPVNTPTALKAKSD